ncbi:MAG: beta-mannosidase [Oscillospiraceae bacterium]|nr:beta-mannosidase [Oscillospiraceae bacterium]
MLIGCTQKGELPDHDRPEVTPTGGPVGARERLPRPERTDPIASIGSGSMSDSVVYMAQDAGIYGSLVIQSDKAVGRFEQKDPEDKLEFTINIAHEGFYNLEFVVQTHGGFKSNYLTINNEPAGEFTADSDSGFSQSIVRRIHFDAGTHTVAITSHWGWISIYSLTVVEEAGLDFSFFEVPIELVNPNADDNALGLMSFLAMQYGQFFISGQQSQGDWRRNHGLFGGEAQHIYEITGKRPALIGLDFIDYTPSRQAFGASSFETEAALEAWENNAIVTFCWHWGAPTPYITGTWYRAFYTDHSQRGFFKKIMDGNDPEGYQMLLDDIDVIAEQLAILRDAGVPILWRPLHEASGGWFWWGTDREGYLELWKIMFERLTYHHNMTNLIWVWNGQHKDWYPGDEYVDIIGEDIYTTPYDYSSKSSRFFEAAEYTDAKKIIVLSENGELFDPDLAMRDGARWGYWCVWNGEFTTTEQHTTNEMLIHVYNHRFVLTLEDLPDLKTFPIYID